MQDVFELTARFRAGLALFSPRLVFARVVPGGLMRLTGSGVTTVTRHSAAMLPRRAMLAPLEAVRAETHRTLVYVFSRNLLNDRLVRNAVDHTGVARGQ